MCKTKSNTTNNNYKDGKERDFKSCCLIGVFQNCFFKKTEKKLSQIQNTSVENPENIQTEPMENPSQIQFNTPVENRENIRTETLEWPTQIQNTQIEYSITGPLEKPRKIQNTPTEKPPTRSLEKLHIKNNLKRTEETLVHVANELTRIIENCLDKKRSLEEPFQAIVGYFLSV